MDAVLYLKFIKIILNIRFEYKYEKSYYISY